MHNVVLVNNQLTWYDGLTSVCVQVGAVSQDLHLTDPRICPSPSSVISQSLAPLQSRCGSKDSCKYRELSLNLIKSSSVVFFTSIGIESQNLMNGILVSWAIQLSSYSTPGLTMWWDNNEWLFSAWVYIPTRTPYFSLIYNYKGQR